MNSLRDLVVGLDHKIPVFGRDQIYINLDNAASTPPFKSSLRALNNFAPMYSSVHRGQGFKSQISTAAYEEAREEVANFLGANNREHTVIFVKNTTEAINKLAWQFSLQKSDIVLVSHLEHHSNDLPWRKQATVKRIGLDNTGGISRDHYLKLLKEFGGRVKLVAITGASNVNGHMPDIHWFARQAHQIGVQILVDAAQLAAHRPINMGRLDEPDHLDFVAISGHKMYAPFGAGALIARRDVFDQQGPEYPGGGTVKVVTEDDVEWAPSPERDEPGSPNVLGVIAMSQAIKTLQEIGLNKIAQHEAALTDYALFRLGSVPGLRLYTPHEARLDRGPVIPFTLQGLTPLQVARELGAKWGIGVRSGCFCAQPLVATLLGIDANNSTIWRQQVLNNPPMLQPGLVRVSFGLYNTMAEIELLTYALRSLAQGKNLHPLKEVAKPARQV